MCYEYADGMACTLLPIQHLESFKEIFYSQQIPQWPTVGMHINRSMCVSVYNRATIMKL